MSSELAQAKRLVAKVGSSLVTNRGQGLDHAALTRWVLQIASLRRHGREVILVSSGAIAEGMLRLGFTARPTDIHELQACAACGLQVQAWRHSPITGGDGNREFFMHVRRRPT